MAKPYQSEIARLGETLAWAGAADVAPIEVAVRTAAVGPLIAVGSGGSLSTAHALAWLHRSVTGQASTVLTPLESVSVAHDSNTAVWLLSASGGNVDIVTAAKGLVLREPRQLAALIGREDSKIGAIAFAHPYMDLLVYAPPSGKDGFLATNTLFGAAALLTRAYGRVASSKETWGADGPASTVDATDASSRLVAAWREAAHPLWSRETTVVLHGSSGALAAIDLESKFTEAAVGSLHVADYRNFAHGRHHWLAKRGDRSGIVALISDADQDIADRTLALLPPEIPVARIELPGPPLEANLTGLVAAMRLTDWAGQARGVDPGDPGVPEFGRRIYHLAPSRRADAPLPRGVTRRAAAAIERKSGQTIARLTHNGALDAWRSALRVFERQLQQAPIGGVVLDYDGTVVDTRHRFEPPLAEMVRELLRVLEAGAVLGIATGRGRSVREAFQKAIPSSMWKRVIIGYYNGAEISTLDDQLVPSQDQKPAPELEAVANRLLSDPELAAEATQEHRRHQLTITSEGALREDRLWELVQMIVRDVSPNTTVLRSSHSIDVLDSSASKRHVIERVHNAAAGGAVLAIGDRGRWPGNDHEMLSSPLSLSVDQTSASRVSGWNLGSPGQRGTAITLEYLRALIVDDDGKLRIRGAALR